MAKLWNSSQKYKQLLSEATPVPSTRKTIIVSIATIIISLFVAGLIFTFATRKPIPIPYSIRRQLKYRLYYPIHLPAGFRVDNKSFQVRNGVLIFNISSDYGNIISVTEETLPTDVAVQELNNASKAPIQITGEKDFFTPVGHAHIGLWGVNYVSDIVANGTWIIINVTGYPVDRATQVTQSFSAL